MSDLSILYLGHPQPRDSGDWLHRVDWPGRALAERVQVSTIQTLHPEWVREALEADVLVVLMLVEPILAEIIRQRRQKGRATVFEISDDFSAVGKANPLFGYYGRPEVQALVLKLAAESDAVQFSSWFLARKYASLNAKTLVCLNQLNEVAPSLDWKGDDVLRIGWAGSIGHLEDAERLAEWIGNWPAHSKVKWCLMCSETIAKVFRKAGIEVSARPTGNMKAYLDFLKDLDIGLAWVGDDDFSQGRSDGKFLEYASSGVLPVCRNSPVYSSTLVDGQTGFLFEDETALHGLLDRFLADPKMIQRIRKQAYEHVVAHRTHKVDSQNRLNFYEALTSLRSAQSPSYSELSSEIEPELYIGLNLVNKGQYLEAFNRVLSVMERVPDFFFVWQVLETICLSLGRTQEAQQCARRKAVLLHQDLPF